MTKLRMPAAAIPRFLLPQLSWSARVVRPTALTTIDARRHITSPGHNVSGASVATALGQRSQLRGRTEPQSFAAGCNAAELFKRSFSATAPQFKDHHFDTLKFVQRLKAEGFTEEQAEGMMRVLSDVIEERSVPCQINREQELTTNSIQNLTRTMVLREDQEKATYTQKVDFAKLRSELMTADSTESSLTRASHERLTNELAKLNSRLRDEIQRTQASVRLDLNLEKGRIREEANVQELKLKETETRIEQETAQLRERLEAVKFSTLQWLM